MSPVQTSTDTDIARIVRAALKLQDTVSGKLSPDKRRAGEGRIGKLVVDDPGGTNHTILYFRVLGGRLTLLDYTPEKVRNEIIFYGDPPGYTGVQVFLDGLQHPGWLRKAYAEKWLIVTGDLAEYDSEEMLQLCEEMIIKVAQQLHI